MRSRRRDSTTYAMQGSGTAVTLLLLLLKDCSAAPHGGSAPAPSAEMFSPHSNGQITTAQSVVAERHMTTTWDTEAGVSELTTHTASTSGDTVPPTTTELAWSTLRDQEGTTTTTTTTGDDHTEQAATTELRQTQTQTWEKWTTQTSTLLNGALGDLGNSDSHDVTAESDRTVATDTLEKDEQGSTDAELQCRYCRTPAEDPAVGTEEEALETETKPASTDVTGPQLHLQHHAEDPANPYDHFDSDSEEQEMEVEQEHHPQTAAGSQEEGRDQQQDEEEEEERLGGLEYEDSLGPGSTEGQPAAAAVATTQRSYLLQLAGNSTIVMLRRSDFAKYLKLNLAARLSLEYDNVKVNRVLLEPPRLLVNVSVITPDEGGGGGAGAAGGRPQPEDQQEEPLHALAEANATLLELSGEEYHVVRMLPLRSRKSSRDGGAGGDQEEEGDAEDLEAAERYTDGELAAYCVLGGACAVAAVGALLLASARYLRGLAACLLGGGGGGGAGAGGGHGGGEALLQSFLSAPWRLRHHRMADAAGAAPGAPSVIYSGSFAGSGADATASWTSGLQPQQQQQQSPSTPAASRLRLFSCRSTSLLLPPRRIGLPTKDLLQPLSTPAGHENPAYRE